MSLHRLTPEKVSTTAQNVVARLHPTVVEEVATAVARDRFVVVGMAQNPFVKKARRLLDEAGTHYTYLEYGSYFSQWKERLALKLWAGFPTFPMVFVDGTLEGGHSELMELAKTGRLKS